MYFLPFCILHCATCGLSASSFVYITRHALLVTEKYAISVSCVTFAVWFGSLSICTVKHQLPSSFGSHVLGFDNELTAFASVIVYF